MRAKLINIVRFAIIVANFSSCPFSTENMITESPIGRIKERHIIILKSGLNIFCGKKKNKDNPTKSPTPYLITKTFIIEIHSFLLNLKWRKTPSNNHAKAVLALAKISMSSEKKPGIPIPEKLSIIATK